MEGARPIDFFGRAVIIIIAGVKIRFWTNGLSPNPVFRRLSVVGPVWMMFLVWRRWRRGRGGSIADSRWRGVLVEEEEALDEDEYAAREDSFIRKALVWRRDLEKTIFC